MISDDANEYFSNVHLKMVDDDEKSILNAVETLENSDKSVENFGLLVITDEPEKIFKSLAKRFRRVTAAGGVVYNEANELLLIKRQGKWDLPKGKRDDGEEIETAAIREVQEECGISNLEIRSFITLTYHTYFLEGKRVLKTTHWYQMQYTGTEVLIPQTEENITEAAWFNIRELNIDALDTYNSIRWLLGVALKGR